MKVSVRHIKGLHFQGEGSSKVLINIDASVTAGGTGHGVSPMELLLMSIAGCSGMDIVTILEKMDVKFRRFETTVEGERASDHPRVFRDIEIVYKFWGEGLTKEKIERAVQLSIEKYCSVANMIDKAADLTYRIEINS
ncbi:putative redox protein, regulator of disulfide bond formation [Desulfosporosinus orientis DSM 765]|uniref:Putative redox protein, regulator of disulfide bond formation n=1 Tax=Desulfosporosinus orientis (strain ATCC 19365 / DSM 765 / NCIMB 8382 / VKM B-1628 / Singapore I) TaxID=768706 RepID=G7WBK2_DESOD|nr:OsmC family protein [Desulfosporosinus orientis]AET68760.1 putative redox protein, regulator of disulfide bond formation [Desulfosporosinus orientis DSM 765]